MWQVMWQAEVVDYNLTWKVILQLVHMAQWLVSMWQWENAQ
jgi:hypothetical protein